MSYAGPSLTADKRAMEVSRQPCARDPARGTAGFTSDDVRALLAATAADVCVVARAPFCVLSSLHGDDACVVAVQGARSHGAPPAGTRWRVSDVPPARQAVVSGRAVAPADRDAPRLTPEQRAALTGDAGLDSLAFIPLLSNGLVVGLMVLGDSRPRDLAEVAPQIGAIVRLAATVLAQDQRLDELERRNRVLHEIVALGARVNQTTEPSGLARFVARRLTEAIGATCCEIYKIERGELRCLVSLDVRPGFDDPAAYEPLAMSAFPSLERAAQSRDLLVFAGADDPRLTAREREIYRRWDFGSELSIPLFSDDRLVGLIDIFDQRPRDYAEHLDFARSVGQIVAGAFANVLLLERLAETNQDLRLLAESSLELAASLDLRRILDATARRLCAAARVGACDIYRLRGQALDCRASIKEGRIDEARLARSYDLETWRAASLAMDSRSVINVATLDDPRLSEVERRDMARDGQKSALIVPLIVESRVIGLAALHETDRERTFTDDEIAMVEAVCRMAALAVTNADLFADLQMRNQEAELLNRIAVKIGSSLESSSIAAATIHELAAFVPFGEACLVFGEPGKPWDAIYSTTSSFERFREAGEEAVPPALRDALLRESVVTVDLEREDPGPVAGGGLEGMRSLLAIGVWIDDRLNGALALASRERDAFAAADRDLLGRVGAQLALSFKNARLYETIKTMHVANLKALISALNARDYYAVGHAARVAAYMLLLGRELGWQDERLPQIIEASFLHDVGRIGVADSVLFKPGLLSAAETAELRNHPVAGAEIVRPLFSDDLVLAVRHHHERWDGHGYPDGLAGEAIPALARALCIVDSYDAMSFERPHRAALGYAECLSELERCRGKQFDPAMVTAFRRVLDRLDERRGAARAAAEKAAARIDATALIALSTRGDEGLPEYDVMAATLREVRDAAPEVRFLTSMVHGHDGWKIVCDPEEDPALHSSLGDPADRSSVGADVTLSASTRNILELDDYGIWVCGIADVVDDKGGPVGLVCADLTPAHDWPDELGSNIAGHDQALSAIVESATARLGRARVDAVTDGLTGLYNQRYFKQRLGEEVARATEVGRPLALLFCDLDDFKAYNDRFGHTAGDRALRAVAGVLSRCIRQVDLAARYGGEELTVILMDTTPAGALEVAERIRAGVAALDLGGPERGLTVSVGVAVFPDDAALIEELIDKADWAMYVAKRQGRDRVMPFGPGAHEKSGEAPATQ